MFSGLLNLIERWFAAITQDQTRRGTHRSTKELETAIQKYLDVYNENPKPFIWTRWGCFKSNCVYRMIVQD